MIRRLLGIAITLLLFPVFLLADSLDPLTYSPSLWLKADAGITKDGSNRVSLWADQSGNGNNFTQAGADGIKPTWVASAVNNFPGLLFTAANSQFLSSTKRLSDIFAVSAADLFLAIQPATIATSRIFGDSGDAFMLAGGAAGAATFYHWTGSYQQVGGGNGTLVNGKTILLNLTHDSGNILFRADGVAAAPVASGDGVGYNATLYLGKSNTAAFFDGYVLEVIAFNSALSAANRSIVESYLRSQWISGRGGMTGISRGLM